MHRQRQSLDGYWQFWKDPNRDFTHASLPPESARPITVPAPWQAQFDSLRNDFGVGWYRRTFDLPQDWMASGGLVILHFGAVDYRSSVWVNDVRAGDHEGGYLPFEFDITTMAVRGQNTVTVRVEDELEEFGEVPHGKQSWYGPLSGLWQSVWVELRPQAHILGCRITPARQQVEVSVRLSRPLAEGDYLDYRVDCPAGSCAAGTASGADFVFLISDPVAWEPDAPFLYTLTLTLKAGGEEDIWQETFGFRTIEASGGRLLLNGRPLMLRAALDQDYYPHGISTPPSAEFIEDQLQKAKLMGLNCMRVHIKVADPRYYEIADRLGILIWTELPNWQWLTDRARHNARQTLDGILERDWNHPSIIIWTIINENWGTNLALDPEHRAWLAETYDYLKSVDPLRLVTDNSACYGNFHVATDLEDFHIYYAMPDHYESFRDWTAAFARRAPWTFAPQFQSAEEWVAYLQNPWADVERPYAPEVRRTGSEPLILSEFGNWGLPDLAALRACYEGNDPWWFETGYEWGSGVVYPHGVEQRFYDFHLNRVFADYSALARASQRLEFQALKYEIEQIRLHPSLSGYVITEFTDVHWECNGLLDMCRNPKIFFEEIGRVNADDLIIPLWERLACWPGETISIPLALSTYSGRDFTGSRLAWRLDGFPHINGVLTPAAIEPYGVVQVGQVSFEAPQVQAPSRAALIFELTDASGDVAACSTQELYFFPALPAPAVPVFAPELGTQLSAAGYTLSNRLEDARLVIAENLTEEMYRYAQAGGRVLWLAGGPNPQPSFFPVAIEARSNTPLNGDWASTMSWLRNDRVFTSFPSVAPVDFAFAGITPDNYIANIPAQMFADHVHAGIFAGWLHKNSALAADLPVGRGQLLVCTFRISPAFGAHPVAAAMLHDMVRFLEK